MAPAQPIRDIQHRGNTLIPTSTFSAEEAAAAEDAAGAEAEAAAADVALWDEARNVDIDNDDIVAVWDHLPGL